MLRMIARQRWPISETPGFSLASQRFRTLSTRFALRLRVSSASAITLQLLGFRVGMRRRRKAGVDAENDPLVVLADRAVPQATVQLARKRSLGVARTRTASACG